MPQVKLPDGSIKSGDTPLDVAKQIGPKLAADTIGARVNDTLWDANRPLPSPPGGGAGGEGASAEPLNLVLITRPRVGKDGRSQFRDEQHQKDALYLLRHSTAHVMAEAIQRLWPAAQLAYGPPLDTGFYYDIALDTPISADDFPKIEAEMAEITAENRPFSRYDLPCNEGTQKLEAEGNKYKIDNAQRAIAGGAATLSWYVTGEAHGVTPWASGHWEDLCQGPHVPSTGVIGAFKVTSIASSHWHGDVGSDRFQRVYGTAFFTKEDLEHHLALLEEAKQRDHRVIGQKLGLFAIDEMVGPGLILWKPRGAMVRSILQDFLQKELLARGYEVVYTPHIGKIDLYKCSGHYPYYADSQFPPIKMRDSEDEYLLKPMNCPHHIRIFASEKRSYRDLPIRMAEFGTVYRFEQSGELTGMTRVRGFTQDDAHIFCTHEQVPGEFRATVELVQFVFKTFGFADVTIRLSLRDPDPENKKYGGDPAVWDRAEGELRDVLRAMNVPFIEGKGEAAFYGPKVDFIVRDVIGRSWQLGTVQLDYVLPQRFGIRYVGADNAEHQPVMIHRAPFGSMERFMAILIEHYAGAFPLWLSPEQARVLPVSDKFLAYAKKVSDTISAAGLRVKLDDRNDRLNGKIKVAQDEKVPYMLVVGGKDEAAGTVSVRHRTAGDQGAVALDQFIAAATAEVREKR